MSSHSHSRPVSQASKRFPEYTGRIPTVPKHERPKRVEHFALRPYVVFTIAPAMVLLGIALQVALFFSMKWNGFRAPPPSKVLSWLSPSFLTSFFPTILIATPMAMTWGLADWAVRWYHPYILLSQGNARAEDSLLLDYIATNKYMGWWSSLRRRHWLVFISMFTGFVANLFQPLAGALISIKPIATTNDFVVRNTAQIGLSPTVGDLNAFLAAAGFTEAAAFQSLPDPPFVKENWAAATIEQPSDPGLNASVQWNTTGVRTQSNCVNAIGVNVSLSGGFGTIDGSTPAGCRASARFNLADADQQYGSAPADPGSCGMDTNTEQHFRPVMFWYFHAAEDNSTQPQARAVICQPTLQVSYAEVTLNLTNSALSNVILLDQYTKTNNVSGGDLDGRAFNAVILDDFAQGKPFVQARATAIRSGIPGAVFRLATQQSGGLEAAFNNDTTFFNLTDKIYTQHLSVSAKSVYFVPDDSQSFARKTALVERIVIDPLACGLLSGALIIVGLVGFVLHAFHLRIRRRSGLYLTTEPGSIATSVALTSHSGFGQLLYPYDDRDEMEKKLQGFRFSLDKRSGAIVADEDETDWEPGFHPAHLRESILVENRANEDRYSMKSAMMASASRLSLVEDLPSVGMEAPRARSPSSPLSGAEESQPLNRSFDESPRRLDISQPFPSPHA